MPSFKSVIQNCRSTLLTLLKIFLLILLCAFFSFAIVFPLWKFATVSPRIYSLAVLLIIAAAAVYSIIVRVRRAKKTAADEPEYKRISAKKTLLRFISAAVWCAAAAGAVILVMKGLRLAALACIAAAVLISGMLSIGSKKQ